MSARAAAVATALLALAVLAAPAHALPQDPPGHDPTLMREGDWYYAYTTPSSPEDGLLGMRRSRDLITWESLGSAFPALPGWIAAALGHAPDSLWAPDLSYFDGRYHLYYTASQYGTNNSVIGHATSPTLDPGRAGFGWTDEGVVLRTTPGVDFFNALDPEVAFDDQGAPWLAFGSFFSGLKLRRLDPATGRFAQDHPVMHDIAGRRGGIEAASTIRHGGFFYLLASFDGCCTGLASTYHLAIGRSRDITGPYVDRSGAPMMFGGGTTLLEGYATFAGTGHNDTLQDGDVDWLIHHYYDRQAEGARKLSVRRMEWDEEGWPIVGEPMTAGPIWSAGWASAVPRL